MRNTVENPPKKNEIVFVDRQKRNAPRVQQSDWEAHRVKVLEIASELSWEKAAKEIRRLKLKGLEKVSYV